jgi:La domain
MEEEEEDRRPPLVEGNDRLDDFDDVSVGSGGGEGEAVGGRHAVSPASTAPQLLTTHPIQLLLRDQLDFLFSDANLHKDGYLRSLMRKQDGSVALGELRSFKRIGELLTLLLEEEPPNLSSPSASTLSGTIQHLTAAIDASTQLATDGTRVKRLAAFVPKGDAFHDARTLYFEGFPALALELPRRREPSKGDQRKRSKGGRDRKSPANAASSAMDEDGGEQKGSGETEFPKRSPISIPPPTPQDLIKQAFEAAYRSSSNRAPSLSPSTVVGVGPVVTYVSLPRYPRAPHHLKGFGFVEFEDEESVRRVLRDDGMAATRQLIKLIKKHNPKAAAIFQESTSKSAAQDAGASTKGGRKRRSLSPSKSSATHSASSSLPTAAASSPASPSSSNPPHPLPFTLTVMSKAAWKDCKAAVKEGMKKQKLQRQKDEKDEEERERRLDRDLLAASSSSSSVGQARSQSNLGVGDNDDDDNDDEVGGWGGVEVDDDDNEGIPSTSAAVGIDDIFGSASASNSSGSVAATAPANTATKHYFTSLVRLDGIPCGLPNLTTFKSLRMAITTCTGNGNKGPRYIDCPQLYYHDGSQGAKQALETKVTAERAVQAAAEKLLQRVVDAAATSSGYDALAVTAAPAGAMQAPNITDLGGGGGSGSGGNAAVSPAQPPAPLPDEERRTGNGKNDDEDDEDDDDDGGGNNHRRARSASDAVSVSSARSLRLRDPMHRHPSAAAGAAGAGSASSRPPSVSKQCGGAAASSSSSSNSNNNNSAAVGGKKRGRNEYEKSAAAADGDADDDVGPAKQRRRLGDSPYRSSSPSRSPSPSPAATPYSRSGKGAANAGRGRPPSSSPAAPPSAVTSVSATVRFHTSHDASSFMRFLQTQQQQARKKADNNPDPNAAVWLLHGYPVAVRRLDPIEEAEYINTAVAEGKTRFQKAKVTLQAARRQYQQQQQKNQQQAREEEEESEGQKDHPRGGEQQRRPPNRRERRRSSSGLRAAANDGGDTGARSGTIGKGPTTTTTAGAAVVGTKAPKRTAREANLLPSNVVVDERFLDLDDDDDEDKDEGKSKERGAKSVAVAVVCAAVAAPPPAKRPRIEGDKVEEEGKTAK